MSLPVFCYSTRDCHQRSRLGLKDILTVFVNLPPYDELSLLRSNHGMAEWFCPARPARQELRMQEMSVISDQISRWQLRSKPLRTGATAGTVMNINKVVETSFILLTWT